MAEERPSQVQPVAKDPVFLLMVSGQIESAEVGGMHGLGLY